MGQTPPLPRNHGPAQRALRSAAATESCPHSNACLTWPVFITTPEFLPQLRLVEMNRRTADNPTKIIDGLDGETPADDSGDNDAG